MLLCWFFFFFFLMIRRPPRSTLFPTRRSSDLFEYGRVPGLEHVYAAGDVTARPLKQGGLDRKSTRLNSSHMSISYAVFCLKKKKKKKNNITLNPQKSYKVST